MAVSASTDPTGSRPRERKTGKAGTGYLVKWRVFRSDGTIQSRTLTLNTRDLAQTHATRLRLAEVGRDGWRIDAASNPVPSTIDVATGPTVWDLCLEHWEDSWRQLSESDRKAASYGMSPFVKIAVDPANQGLGGGGDRLAEVPIAPKASGSTPHQRVHRSGADLGRSLSGGLHLHLIEPSDHLAGSRQDVGGLEHRLGLGDGSPGGDRIDLPELRLDVAVGQTRSLVRTASSLIEGIRQPLDLGLIGGVEREHRWEDPHSEVRVVVVKLEEPNQQLPELGHRCCGRS